MVDQWQRLLRIYSFSFFLFVFDHLLRALPNICCILLSNTIFMGFKNLIRDWNNTSLYYGIIMTCNIEESWMSEQELYDTDEYHIDGIDINNSIYKAEV